MPTGNLSTTDTAITSRPTTGPNTEQAATARQGSLDHRRVSTQNGGSVASVRESADSASGTVATPASARTVSLADASVKSLDWFAKHLPPESLIRPQRSSFELSLVGWSTAAEAKNEMKNAVDFLGNIDKDIGRAAELLAKAYETPLNAGDQEEVNTLLRAGKYNLGQVQNWASVVRDGLQEEGMAGSETHEFFIKLQERLADRHMDLADMMCLFDIDHAAPEQAVSRADRIDYHLTAADAALKVVGGLSTSGLPEGTKQKLVDILQDHRAELGQAKDIATGRSSDSDKSQVVSARKEVMWESFSLTKGKKAGDVIASLHKHWDAKAAGATGRWLPLAHPEITQERMLQEFVGHQLKRAGVAKKDMPDLRFQFKEAANQVRNERPWEPIEKQLNYAVGGISGSVRSTITPAGAMADRFAEPYPANGNGVCCSDRMQYTHVPNLARTELTDASGTTLFSALRHGVLDAYDISVANLRKLPEQELTKMVTDLLGSPDIRKKGENTAAQNSGLDDAAPLSVTDSNGIAYLDKLDNVCPEETALVAANHFNLECKFEDYKDEADNKGQIDIFPPLTLAAPTGDALIRLLDGKTEENCLRYLQGLDKSKMYLLRTGQNNRAGHNQILYSKDNEWFANNGGRNERPLTAAGALTEGGEDLLVKKYATWGMGDGEASADCVPITEQGVKDLIEYVKDFRNESDDIAMINLYAAHNARMKEAEDLAEVDKICGLIRTGKSAAATVASDMRTAASTKMAEELAVAALVSDPDKLQAALDGKVVDLNLSSISLLTPDRVRPISSGPKSNERKMLRHQTEALQSLSGRQKNLQVRDASGDLRTVVVNCKVRTFNFGVNEGAVSKPLHIIPQDTPGWGKLMGWSYAMERNNLELKALLGDPESTSLGGSEVDKKLIELEAKESDLLFDLGLAKSAQQDGTNPESTAAISKLERECAAIGQRSTALEKAALDAKEIWREGSYNKGGQDPYKMVSRLGVVINAMGETLAFNCKSGKDRTGQLDAELKYLSALSAGESQSLPEPGAPATPELRQMRSDFTLGTGNLEMQRLNTGLPGFKLKGVPGLANYIAGPEMEEMYLGGSSYVKG